MSPFRLFPDNQDFNESVSPWLRWLSVGILAAGFAMCVLLGIDTVRHWSARPNPAFQLAFLAAVGVSTGFVAVRLASGRSIARAVHGPPRPIVVRVIGLLTLISLGPVALISEGWVERVEFGLLALGGLGLLWAPTRFFPQQGAHGA